MTSSSTAKAANQNAPSGAKVVRLDRRMRPFRSDQEFLPAALEILETPASPIRMTLILVIAGLVVVSLILAYVGRLDVVAIAQGKLQPTGRVKVIQSLEAGRVRLLHTENGAHVKAGDVLVELDPTEIATEEAGLAAAHASSQAEMTRRRAAILIVRGAPKAKAYTSPPIDWDEGTPKATRIREDRVLTGDLSQLTASIASLDAQARQKMAEQTRLTDMIAAQKKLIMTLQERVTMRATLVERNAGTRASLIDATETLQLQQGALAIHTGQLAEAGAALEVISHEIAKARETFVADNTQKLAEAERTADDTEQRLARVRARREHMTLKSPLDGTVQGLALTTVGQVATVGEELMRIVPDGSVLEIEAYLPNRDIGFVRAGQEATVKIESLPFTRYGTVQGTIVRVGSDAIPEPDAQQIEGNAAKSQRSTFTGGAQRTQNLVFPVTLRPAASSVMADGVQVPLSPGMAVSVEIKTGQRRILEYVFSPLVEIGSQALRER